MRSAAQRWIFSDAMDPRVLRRASGNFKPTAVRQQFGLKQGGRQSRAVGAYCLCGWRSLPARLRSVLRIRTARKRWQADGFALVGVHWRDLQRAFPNVHVTHHQEAWISHFHDSGCDRGSGDVAGAGQFRVDGFSGAIGDAPQTGGWRPGNLQRSDDRDFLN